MEPALTREVCESIESYRAQYLGFFLRHFEAHCTPALRGGCFNLNSVTGQPYRHKHCFSWTDGRSLGELAVSYLYELGDRCLLHSYCEHLRGVLLERHARNGYYPHVVHDDTNLAAEYPLNTKIEPGGSSYSHVFCLNGLYEHGLIFDDLEALRLAQSLLEELGNALRNDRFLEGEKPKPEGQRSQGPFMISLGAFVDMLETAQALFGRQSTEFAQHAEPLLTLGWYCLEQILANHHRPADHAFWEVSEGNRPVRDREGRVITDPGHTIEFTGFAARFATFLGADECERLHGTLREILLWAARRGFHPGRDLIYKNVDRDTGEPIRNEYVEDISKVVSPQVLQEHFGGSPQSVRIATFPWWVPMELLAAGSLLRHGDETGEVDGFILRAARGVFEHYSNDRIGGLCYQNIGDGFFRWIDIPPATASLDLMHSHRSMRVFIREVWTPNETTA